MNVGEPRRRGVLRKRTDFETVLQQGLRLASTHFVLRACENDAGYPRLGIIAGRRVAPRAVDRNRGKRLIREAFRLSSPALGAIDVAIQMRGDLRLEQNNAVRAELERLLSALARRYASAGDQHAAPRASTTGTQQ